MKKILGTLWGVVVHPRSTFADLADRSTIRLAAAFVLSYGIFTSALFLFSYLRRDWPPPPEELRVWISAWGEFSQLPFLKISAEQYRLFQAIIMIPLVLAIWMLMAGTARLLGRLFNGRVTFDQYLNLLAFSFFPFWLLATLLDTAFNVLLGPRLIPALQGAYGPIVGLFAIYFEPVMYVFLFGLAGVYNGLAAHTAESFVGAAYPIWKSALVGLLTFAWPMVLISSLLR